ncbi:hypothetical protein JW898_05760 [Candidatus Woesearchaeota archaeon]|nr:hypothetical protein [Candidatus Woesearchaeota archaeon]
MEDALDIRVNSASLEGRDTYIPAKLVHKDRPSLSVELFKRRICGTVIGVMEGRFRGRRISIYELSSDEILDPAAGRLNSRNRKRYCIAGSPGLVRHDRVHAYVSHMRHAVAADDGKTVLARLVSWYDRIYNTEEGSHT